MGAIPPPPSATVEARRRAGGSTGRTGAPGTPADLPVTMGRNRRRGPITEADIGLDSDGRSMAESGARSTGRKNFVGTETLGATLDGTVSLSADSIRKYRFRDEIGRGGLGVVHLAEDTGLRRELAIKVLRDPRDPNAVADFVEEAQITGQLAHPNIVPVYELGKDPQGRPFMAMKLVGGRTLQELCSFIERKNGKSNLASLMRDRRLESFQKVCDAVGYAHSRGVIHRDLKPENVMVGEFGEVLVMDWGLAKPIGAASATTRTRAQRLVNTDLRDTDRPDVTMIGDVFGTPAYMPPEQANGETDSLDERTDIYALGATLYELLTLEPPYVGRTVDEVLARARRGKVIPPRRRAPHLEIPAELEAIVMKAMAADPRQRYRKVSDLRADVDAYLANEPGSAWSDGPMTRMTKWAKRNPGSAMGSVMSVVLVLVIGVVAAVFMAMIAEKTAAQEASDRRAAEAAAESERVDQQRELDRATAQIKEEADKRRIEREAEARAKAEREREAAEEAAERAALKALAESGRLAELQRRLAGQQQREVERIVAEFQQKWNEAESAGIDNRAFFDSLAQDMIRSYIGAIESLVAESEAQHEILHTANQLVYCGLLYYMGLNDASNGEKWFSNAIEMQPDLFWAWTNRGFARAARADIPGAIADFEHALEMRPDNATAKQQLQRLRGMSGTIQSIEDRLRANPDDVDALLKRADWRWANNARPGSVEDMQHAARLQPDDWKLWNLLGDRLSNLNRYEEALVAYRRQMDLHPPESSDWVNVANALRVTGHPEDAIDAANKAIELDAKNWRAYVNRGWAHQQLNQPDDAVSNLHTAWELTPDPAWKQTLAKALRELGSPVD